MSSTHAMYNNMLLYYEGTSWFDRVMSELVQFKLNNATLLDVIKSDTRAYIKLAYVGRQVVVSMTNTCWVTIEKAKPSPAERWQYLPTFTYSNSSVN